MKPPRSGVAIWESSPAFEAARTHVSALRRGARHEEAKEAARELAETYNREVKAHIDLELRHLDRIGTQLTAAVVTDRLTGKKRRPQPNVSGDTPAERRATVVAFFSQVTNATPPQPSSLHLPAGAALPVPEDFNSRLITVPGVASSTRIPSWKGFRA